MFENSSAISLGKVQGRAMKLVQLEEATSVKLKCSITSLGNQVISSMIINFL